MAELKQANGRTVIDYMARDAGSFLQSMRALIPEKLPEWTDYESEADFGNVLLELFAHMGDILSYYQDRVVRSKMTSTFAPEWLWSGADRFRCETTCATLPNPGPIRSAPRAMVWR
jgi:hypothetical protein